MPIKEKKSSSHGIKKGLHYSLCIHDPSPADDNEHIKNG